MRYYAPKNYPATVETPQPSYPDGNPAAGIKGAIPPGKAIEHPMREILAVINAGGLVPSEADTTQLLQAINAIIAAAISNIVIEEQELTLPSLAYNPIYPEILTGGGLMTVTASSGQVQIAAGQQFVHRGGNLYNTTDTDVGDRTFSTLANKTYHLRWRHNGGSPVFVLSDLADAGYNPATAAETADGFDSAFDDMLIARVVTDGNNAPTVTALKNLHVLRATGEELAAKGGLSGNNMEDQASPSALTQYKAVALNWARRPDAYLTAANDVLPASTGRNEFSVGVRALSRYQLAVWGQGDVDIWTGWAARA